MPILTQQGTDVTHMFQWAAEQTGIPLRLALGACYAESKLNERAERYGVYTAEALKAYARADMAELQRLINLAWADVSFGLGQRIVKYHWAGDRSAHYGNVLGVRSEVFNDPARDIREMCAWLRSDYDKARGVNLARIGGDVDLGACIIYNAGHWPEDGEAYWTTHASNLDNYRAGLAWADRKIAELSLEPATPAETDSSMTIEERAAEIGPEKLGNNGTPDCEVIEWAGTNGELVRFQMYWYLGFLEYPAADGDRHVLTIPEGTALADITRAFQP